MSERIIEWREIRGFGEGELDGVSCGGRGFDGGKAKGVT